MRVPAVGIGMFAASAAVFVPYAVSAQSRATVDVSVGARGSTNPYLAGSDATVGSATLSVDPSIILEDERTTFGFEGHFQVAQYSSRHGTDAAGSLSIRGQTQLNERTSLSTSMSGRSSRSAHDILQLNTAPQQQPESSGPIVPDIIQPDLTVAGSGSRINNLSSQISLQRALAPGSTLSFGLNGGITETSGRVLNDYAQLGLNISYTRQLSERAYLVGVVQASRADYKDRSTGDGTYVTPLAGFNYRLGETVSLSAQAGVTVATVNDGTGDDIEHLDFAANISLCRQAGLSRLCANVARSSQPTALGGISTADNAGISYSLQTGARNNLTLNARYGRTSRIEEAVRTGGNVEVFGFGGRYSHELSRRLAVYGSTSLTRTNYTLGSRSRDSVQIEVGIRQRFGDLR